MRAVVMRAKSDRKVIAAEINRRHRGFGAGTIELWGIMAVRPNDLIYVVRGATAVRDQLLIDLGDPAEPGAQGSKLSIRDPAKLTDLERGVRDSQRVADRMGRLVAGIARRYDQGAISIDGDRGSTGCRRRGPGREQVDSERHRDE